MRWLACVALLSWSFVSLGQEPPLTGRLEERLEAGGYSYLRLTTTKGERWAAVPQTTIAVGEVVTVEAQAEMRDFASPTLKRSWKVITFGTLAGAAAKDPHAAGLPKTLPETPPLEGRVLEKLDTASYTYLRLATKDREVWVAVPRAQVELGAEVKVKKPVSMGRFKSPTLDRSFEDIVFGTLGN